MSHPLQGCFERLVRADSLLEAFKTAIQTLPQTHFDRSGTELIEAKVYQERNLLDLCAAKDLDLPLTFGLIFGEVIHHLHAALDNLAYELGRLRVKAPGHDSAFPILNEANEWFQDSTLRCLYALGPQERALIESHQPFMRRNGVEPRNQVLTRIKRYSNESKHRVVNTLAAVSTGLVVKQIDAPGLRIVRTHDPVQKAFRKGAVMARFDIEVIEGGDTNVNMKGELPWYPAVDGENAEGFLLFAGTYTHDLLVEFANAFFGGPPQAFR